MGFWSVRRRNDSATTFMLTATPSGSRASSGRSTSVRSSPWGCDGRRARRVLGAAASTPTGGSSGRRLVAAFEVDALQADDLEPVPLSWAFVAGVQLPQFHVVQALDLGADAFKRCCRCIERGAAPGVDPVSAEDDERDPRRPPERAKAPADCKPVGASRMLRVRTMYACG